MDEEEKRAAEDDPPGTIGYDKKPTTFILTEEQKQLVALQVSEEELLRKPPTPEPVSQAILEWQDIVRQKILDDHHVLDVATRQHDDRVARRGRANGGIEGEEIPCAIVVDDDRRILRRGPRRRGDRARCQVGERGRNHFGKGVDDHRTCLCRLVIATSERERAAARGKR